MTPRASQERWPEMTTDYFRAAQIFLATSAILCALPSPAAADDKAINGCDVPALSAQILEGTPPKTQFETDAVYAQRLKAKAALAVGGDLATILRCTLPKASAVKYNAEKRGFEISIYSEIYAGSDYQDTGAPYEASNAYGMKVTVKPQTAKSWKVKLPYHSLYPVFVSFDPKFAERNFEDMAFAFTGPLISPFAQEEKYKSNPTISSPFETDMTARTIFINPQYFIIYNARSNQIYTSIKVFTCPLYDTKTMGIGSCPTSPY